MADDRIDERVPLIFRTSSSPPPVDNRTAFKRKLAVWFILIAVAFERLAFYTLAGNLVLFLSSNSIRWSSVHSVGGSLFFFGASYISALFFSWISDARLGRGKTIIVGFILYIIGYLFIPLFSKEHIFEKLCGGKPKSINEPLSYGSEKCSIQITSALVVTAIGVGAVQANMAVFGAEQVREQRETTQYFDKYYAVVNLGSLLAFCIMSYVQQNINWFEGHVASTIFLCVTFSIFLIGYQFYFHVIPYDSVITNFFPVFISALRTWRKYRRHEHQKTNQRRSLAKPTAFGEEVDDNKYIDESLAKKHQSISFLDYAKIVNHGRFPNRVVDDIKAFQPIMIVFLLLVPYWIIYLQTETTFIMQAVHMQIPSIPLDNASMPVIWLSLADQVVIIISIFILNSCVYKHLRAKNQQLSMRVRIIIGMIFAALSMCATGVVEIVRQDKCMETNATQVIGHTNYTYADMSIFYQFPQYFTIGLSEVFTSVASMEFAYLAAPQSAQSLVMSLRFASIGISSLLGSGYISIFKLIDSSYGMRNDECNDSESSNLFYIYFFVLAGIQLFFIFIFIFCDRKFQILKVSQHRFNTRLFIGSSPRTSYT